MSPVLADPPPAPARRKPAAACLNSSNNYRVGTSVVYELHETKRIARIRILWGDTNSVH